MEELAFDTLLDILILLDAVSIARVLCASSKLWKLRENTIIQNEIIQSRIVPYQQFIKYEMWNKGLLLSVSKQNIPQIQYFLDNGADDVNNALFEASVIGNKYLIEFFISQGASRWNRGLEGAALGGNLELVKFFLDKGAKSWINQAMYEAIRGKNRDIINLFIKKGFRWWTEAIEVACEVGDVTTLELAWNKQNVGIDGALFAAASHGRQEMIDILMDRHQLHLEDGVIGAAKSGNRKLVEFFFEQGAKLTEVQDGMQAIQNAASAGSAELVKLFIDKYYHAYSARLYNGNVGDKALKEAAKNNHKEVIELLIPYADCTYGLAGAAEGGHKDLIEFFIQKGAKPNSQCFFGAIRSGRKDLVKYFMARGNFDTNMQEGLCIACECGHKSIVEMLLDYELDKENALINAVEKGYLKIVDLLVERGAHSLSDAKVAASSCSDLTLVKYFEQKMKK